MNELKSLEIQVKHYEEKEKRLKEFIEEEIKSANEIAEKTNNYNLQMSWLGYKRALKLVLRKINNLERVE